jgi:outer membrane protein assembly factor BamB
MSKKPGAMLVLITLEIAFFGYIHVYLTPPVDPSNPSLEYPPTVPEEFSKISRIEITYAEYDPTVLYRFYRIEDIDGVYYSNTGEKIESVLVRSLSESFTDLYESQYEYVYNFFRSDYSPHFTVVVTLAAGEIVIRSDSSYHCFIPWNITYNGVTYVQYNGKIPSALFKIMQRIEPLHWATYDKEARWGCYEAVPLKGYEPSCTFPITHVVTTPEEEKGTQHMLWHTRVKSPVIGRPYSTQKRVFVMASNRMMSLDAETGALVWEVPFEKEATTPFLYSAENVLVYQGAVYCSAPDSWVYSLDYKTGALLWKYKTGAQYSFPIKIIDDNLLALTGGITCLDGKTGALIWEITDDTWNEKFYQDKILIEGYKEDSYRALLDSKTGAVIWKEDLFSVIHPVYHDGTLFYSRPAERLFGSINVESTEELWTYFCGKTVGYAEILEEKILLVLFDRRELLLDSLVLLTMDGREIWTYTYPDPIRWEYGYAVQGSIRDDTLFLMREGGIVEAFSIEDEKRIWETEVRGTKITQVQVYEENIYLSANDGNIYCLNPETGKILWVFRAEHVLARFPDDVWIYLSEIEDGLFFVATGEGNLYAFRSSPPPEEQPT